MSLPEIFGNGLMGYISANIDAPPNNNYGYGVSFYTSAWPLVETPIESFQIGLPSTWIIPDNNDFKQALCPSGTYARDNWPSWGPTWNGVFQTIEGGLGFWVNTQYPSAVPKYRMNNTPDCYNTEVSSPGWQFGGTTPLPANLLGVAQLSNRIVLPPDGITLDSKTNGQMLGVGWMALPILPKPTSPAPTGTESWTVFLNSTNFAGPVAMYTPNSWSRLSQTYSTISARGLDAQPGSIDSGAMEVNTVPYYQSTDTSGNIYSRIPQLQFPVDSDGNTVLMNGVNFYSSQALFTPIENAFKNNKPIPTGLNLSGEAAFRPSCTANALGFTQGQENPVRVTGFEGLVQTYCDNTDGICTFGLKWSSADSQGLFPTYYKQENSDRVAIDVSKVPTSTQLQTQTFAPKSIGTAYQSPNQIDQDPVWNKWVAKLPPANITLADGSSVTYRWYKYVNQPAIETLGLNAQQQNNLQKQAVRLHKAWNKNMSFMPAPTAGELATLDSSILVTPPKGYEYGYVPIAIGQIPPPSSATESVSAEALYATTPAPSQRMHHMFKQGMVKKDNYNCTQRNKSCKV